MAQRPCAAHLYDATASGEQASPNRAARWYCVSGPFWHHQHHFHHQYATVTTSCDPAAWHGPWCFVTYPLPAATLTHPGYGPEHASCEFSRVHLPYSAPATPADSSRAMINATHAGGISAEFQQQQPVREHGDDTRRGHHAEQRAQLRANPTTNTNIDLCEPHDTRRIRAWLAKVQPAVAKSRAAMTDAVAPNSSLVRGSGAYSSPE